VQQQVYDFGNLSTPARTYNLTYVTDANYTSRYIRNRLLTATVTLASGSTTALVTNTYDGYSSSVCSPVSALSARTGLRLHDDTNFGTGFVYRGNVTYTTSLSGIRCTRYETTGVVTGSMDGSGRYVSVSPDSSTGYSLPGVIQPEGSGSLATTVTYASSWAVTSVTGPNGANGTTMYDGYGRPASMSIPDGASTVYTYSYYGVSGATANTQTASIGGRWKKTTLDGFGRSIKVETGYGTTTVNVVDTEYAACACSPLGKLYRVSQPHAPGASAVWTTYYYDGSGRTVKVVAPDGSGTTTEYLTTYGGASASFVRTTDPAGKWKIQKSDGLGNLVQVIEPNPQGGADLTTNYTYNAFNQMTGVSMTRAGVTQTRTFVYSGSDLTSTTNPENGTVTYQYDGAHHVLKKTDARGQETRYAYDSYGRLTQVQHWTWSGATPPVLTEQVDQRYNYYYDTNPCDGSFSQNTSGRLTAVGFTMGQEAQTCVYQYSYNTAGRVTKQKMTWSMANPGTGPAVPMAMTAGYEWDNEGRMMSLTYPGMGVDGPKYTYGFDSMGRVNGMTDANTSAQVGSVTYGTAGEITALSYFGVGESRTYNSLLQMTRQTVTGMMDMQYVFDPNGHNNGRIVKSIDGMLGETVDYTYDSLNRLMLAETEGAGGWGQAFTYDGFGNLTAKTATKGSGVPAFSTSINAATNGGPTSFPQTAPDGMDVENRPMWGSNGFYNYDHAGKRVLVWPGASAVGSFPYTGTWEYAFYGIGGQRLASVPCSYTAYHVGEPGEYRTVGCTPSYNVYFGGKLVKSKGVVVVTDRLGSVRANGNSETFAYYPYGEERGSTADGREKFGTYLRDSSGQDYADQRYYGVGTGRFNVPDPSTGVSIGRPSTWNKYSYVHGDPINFRDPNGLNEAPPEGFCPAEFENCGEWDWFPPGGEGGGGGGGGGGGFVRGPDPNWQTGAQVQKNVSAWDALIAAAMTTEALKRQQEPAFRYVLQLSVVDDW
jgi:RHS repeat-associated protein